MKPMHISIALFALSSLSYAANYDLYIISPYTQSNYPKLFDAWGKKWMDKINNLKKPVADYITKQNSCDSLEVLELSQARSVVRQNVVFFGDCANGERFYISEKDVKNSLSQVKSQHQKMKSISNAEALSRCENLVKYHLNIPDTYNRKFFTTTVYRSKTLGNIVVGFDFTARNYFGQTIPKKAKCVISDNDMELNFID